MIGKAACMRNIVWEQQSSIHVATSKLYEGSALGWQRQIVWYWHKWAAWDWYAAIVSPQYDTDKAAWIAQQHNRTKIWYFPEYKPALHKHLSQLHTRGKQATNKHQVWTHTRTCQKWISGIYDRLLYSTRCTPLWVIDALFFSSVTMSIPDYGKTLIASTLWCGSHLPLPVMYRYICACINNTQY